MKSKTKLSNVVTVAMIAVIVAVLVLWWKPIIEGAAYMANAVIAILVLVVVGWFLEGFIVNVIWAKWGEKKSVDVEIRSKKDISGVVKVWKWWEPLGDNRGKHLLNGRITEVEVNGITIEWNDSKPFFYGYSDLASATGDDIIYKKV